MTYAVDPHVVMMVIGIEIPLSQSLKDKRSVIRSLKDRINRRFSVSIAELKPLDNWQSAYLGFAMIGDNRVLLESTFQHIETIIVDHPEVKGVQKQIEFL